MACADCKNEKNEVEVSAQTARVVADMNRGRDRRFTMLFVGWIVSVIAILVMAACMVWAVNNAQNVANQAVLNALNTVAEMEVTQETTTTQTVEGDSATINNVDGEQYNDNATNQTTTSQNGRDGE